MERQNSQPEDYDARRIKLGQNKTKEKLAAGQRVIGYRIPFHAPNLVELAGEAGLDFVMMDGEHGSITPESAEDMIRAAEVVGVTPIVRAAANRPEIILRYADRGAMGIIVPHVNTRQEAEAAVAAVKYAPQGRRGFVRGRWTLAYPGEEDVFAAANRETLVICMVEERDGLDNLDGIIQVPGVDVVLFGTGDLSQSLGYLGQTRHPKVREVVEHHVIKTVKSRTGPFPVVGIGGLGASDADLLNDYAEKGAQYFSLPAVGLLSLATRQFLEEVER